MAKTFLDAVIVIPTISIETLTLRCVHKCQEYFDTAEIFVVADIDQGTDSLPQNVKLVLSGPVAIAAKRNIVARQSSRFYLAMIDSDAYPSKEWLPNAIKVLEQELDIGAVGGPNISPPKESLSERYVGLACRSNLIMGRNNYRKFQAPARDCEGLPSCNLVVRREEYLNVGGMNEDLHIGEDVDLCYQLRRAKKRIYYTPDVLVFHKNRSMLRFMYQRFSYGTCVWSLLSRIRTLSIAFAFCPLLLVLLLLAIPLSAVFVTKIFSVLLATIGIYIGFILLETYRWAERPQDIPGVAFALSMAHLAYGLGSLAIVIGIVGEKEIRKIYRNDQ